MSTYIVPIYEDAEIYIKKIIANSENKAKDKLYQYFYNAYTSLEGDSLDEIENQLWELGVGFGEIHDIDEFT